MHDAQFATMATIEREYVVRKQLAKWAGLKRLDGETITELFVVIQIHDPAYLNDARALIIGLRTTSASPVKKP